MDVRLPAGLIRFLFGDFTQVYLLKPGQSVESVDVKEVKGVQALLDGVNFLDQRNYGYLEYFNSRDRPCGWMPGRYSPSCHCLHQNL